MPILESEPQLMPDDLFACAAASCRRPHDRWWVLHTRPRAEKAVARWLAARGGAYFLPLLTRGRTLQRRLVRSYVPLFPGYVFFLGDDEMQGQALRSRQVAGCLTVEDQTRLERDLRGLHEMICAGEMVAPEERLEPGMAAEIIRGPLRGQRGVVVRRGRCLRFVIGIDFLQRGASVEVDATMVRAV